MDSSGTSEYYGHAWQTIHIECTREKDEYCSMELSLIADFQNIRNSGEQLTKCWNGLDRK
jgi:hypothetical protein